MTWGGFRIGAQDEGGGVRAAAQGLQARVRAPAKRSIFNEPVCQRGSGGAWDMGSRALG